MNRSGIGPFFASGINTMFGVLMIAKQFATCGMLGALAILAGCTRHDGASEQFDDTAIVGSWKCISWIEADGESEGALDSVFSFQNGQIVITGKGERSMMGQYSLDDSTEPWQIDMEPRPNAGIAKGIVKLEDDIMTICLAPPEGNRPEEFKVADGSDQFVAEFVRISERD
jgi:uncharacterized protein (TIGR03067 family)